MRVNKARRAYVKLEYDGADVSDDISKNLIDFSYTDNTQDKVDEIQMSLHDREGNWRGAWYPKVAAKKDESGSYGDSAKKGGSKKKKSSDGSRRINFPPGFEDITVAKVCGGAAALPRVSIFDAIRTALRGLVLFAQDFSDIMIDGWKGPPGRKSGGSGGKKPGTKSKKSSSAKSTASKGVNASTGSVVVATIVFENWNGTGDNSELYCGSFEVDSFEYSGPPAIAAIKAVSCPLSSSLRREKKTQAWEDVTLNKIANDISSGAGLSLVFEVEEDVKFDRIEQKQEADLPFLQRICKECGVSLKISDGQLVLFEESRYEQKGAVLKFSPGDSNLITYSFTQDSSDSAKSSTVQYKDPKSAKLVSETFTPGNPPAVEAQEVASLRPADLSGDKLRKSVPGGYNPNVKEDYGDVRADVKESALKKAKSRLRERNKKEFTCKLSARSDPRLVGGVTFDVEGFGTFDGKYLIDTVTHSLSGSGCVADIDAHRCLEGY